jgi:Holliday junction resolvasome RuvABC ATP-dependent DNA helicase subunit
MGTRDRFTTERHVHIYDESTAFEVIVRPDRDSLGLVEVVANEHMCEEVTQFSRFALQPRMAKILGRVLVEWTEVEEE